MSDKRTIARAFGNSARKQPEKETFEVTFTGITPDEALTAAKRAFANIAPSNWKRDFTHIDRAHRAPAVGKKPPPNIHEVSATIYAPHDAAPDQIAALRKAIAKLQSTLLQRPGD